jgi:hypothetical protein
MTALFTTDGRICRSLFQWVYRDLKTLYGFVGSYKLFLEVSGRISYAKLDDTEVNNGKHLVETWGTMLSTSGKTGYGQHLRTSDTKQVPTSLAKKFTSFCRHP